jgi:hypothetical protein
VGDRARGEHIPNMDRLGPVLRPPWHEQLILERRSQQHQLTFEAAAEAFWRWAEMVQGPPRTTNFRHLQGVWFLCL